jgi:hypothetical protein
MVLLDVFALVALSSWIGRSSNETALVCESGAKVLGRHDSFALHLVIEVISRIKLFNPGFPP